MKYAKMLGLLAVAAAALMAFVGSASATTLTDDENNILPVGTTIHAESEGATTLDGTINISCQNSTLHGHITDAGGFHNGETTTVKGTITTLTFTNCGNHTVEVKAPGTLEIHGIGKNTGTLTSTGAEVTVLTHSLFLGTRHCIYTTDNTDVGTLTGSTHPGNKTTTATVDIDSLPIPQTFTDSLCGNDAEWTGAYIINVPDHVRVDPLT